MSAAVRRAARQPGPELPTGELRLESPPELAEQAAGGGGGLGQSMIYLPMMIGPALFSIAYQPGQPLSYVIGGVYALSAFGLLGGQAGRGGADRRRRADADRREYLRYLGQVRRRIRRAAAAQREAMLWRHPEPDALWLVVLGLRLWERRPADEDFAHVRIAVGRQRLAVRLVGPDTKPVEDLEPISAAALRGLIQVHASQPDLPVAVDLRGFSRVLLDGDPPAGRALARAAVAQLVTFHAPEHLRLAVCTSPDRLPEWDWVKWLPHARQRPGPAEPGARCLVSTDPVELERLLDGELTDRPWFDRAAPAPADRPHLVVLLDGVDLPSDGQLAGELHAVTLVELTAVAAPADRLPTVPAAIDSTPRDVLRLTVAAGQVRMRRAGADDAGRTVVGRPDALSVPQVEALARLLAPIRLGAAADDGTGEPAAVDVGLPALLGLGDPDRLDPVTTWRSRAGRNRLRVPIGVGTNGMPVELDLKESAEDGMGPHGLVIGATGSGKSELLRTLVLGLALSHPPDVLNFALVDFKGGATFLGMERLPQVSAVITNLAEELPLVDRMQDALHGELVRRQELLRAAGNVLSQRDYERLRPGRPELDPLPALLVVVDEFSELLAVRPEFAELFVMIGRLGRSLGVHLLLASQRLDEGRLRGLETHLSYRIGLRTFSSLDSRAVLGVPDAYELPPAPGNGYLKVGTDVLVRFRSAYVSGRHLAAGAAPPPTPGTGRQVLPFLATAPIGGPAAPSGPPGPPDPSAGAGAASPAGPDGRRVLDVLVDRLAGHGTPARRVWLPPLADPTPLGQLLGPLAPIGGRGLTVADPAGRGTLRVPVGVVDRPFEQRHDPLPADLSGAGGNVAVVGRPRSGKSTLLRTLLLGLALTQTPAEVQFYCVDLGGGTLAGLADLPHVGGVATRFEPDAVRRTVAELTALLERRERDFARLGIDSVAGYRQLRRDDPAGSDPYGDAFLVVDGWQVFRQEFEEIEDAVGILAGRGLAYGLHVVVAANRWSEIRPALRDLLGTRFELRLGEPFESELHRRAAANVPEHVPGRGITKEGRHFRAALPRLAEPAGSGAPDRGDLAEEPGGLRRAVRAVAAAWPGAPAPPVRLLPLMLPAGQLPAPPAGAPRLVTLGLDEQALAPVRLDFGQEPNLVIVGDPETGKSNLLRLIAAQIVDRNPPDQARIVIVDYRRSLLNAVDSEHLIGYAASRPAALALLRDVADALRERLPGPDVTAEQLGSREWWRGPDLYVLVDDHDMVTGPTDQPTLELLELIPQARDIGLHLVLAQRAGGIGRHLFEPVLRTLRDGGGPGVLLSGSRDEGPVLGDVRMRQLPPGRGLLVSRRLGTRLIQTALAPPPPGTAGPPPPTGASG